MKNIFEKNSFDNINYIKKHINKLSIKKTKNSDISNIDNSYSNSIEFRIDDQDENSWFYITYFSKYIDNYLGLWENDRYRTFQLKKEIKEAEFVISLFIVGKGDMIDRIYTSKKEMILDINNFYSEAIKYL